MPIRRLLVLLCCLGLSAQAGSDHASLVEAAARASFEGLPEILRVDDVQARCRGDAKSNRLVRYCSSEARIYLDAAIAATPEGGYLLAHALGHAVQVTQGVADIALAKITAERSRETELRAMVTRQVECIAGVLTARAGVAFASIDTLFESEPFTDSHWGRTPISGGPKVSIGLADRAAWFKRGYDRAGFAACASGEMTADLLVAADRFE